ncbi:MAG: hypothetical protein KME52_12020 [Desmonostoc geniculatum HA4340-LM1]|jgi:hypothetical protein|nr:hypothetical protein [Desmonostoc geniculatum HA4340-LM1]
MNYTELMKAIDSTIEQLGWSQEQVRSHIQLIYNKPNTAMLTNDELLSFMKHLQSLAAGVVLPVALFDEIERYLESQGVKADSEASRLLMALEDLEIDRTVKKVLD